MIYETKDIDDIATKILLLVPSTETKLNKDLEKFIDNLVYKAPEFRNDFITWRQLEYIIKCNVKEIKNEWQIKITKLLN